MPDFINCIFNAIVNVIVKLFPFLEGLLIPLIFLVVCIPRQKKKFSVPQIIKENAVALIGAVVIFILILPFILWSSGLFKENELFHNSDTLGYYGALIGGGVTVLGIYWTFNYERLISAEERKETSLPLLKFSLSMLPEDGDFDNTQPYDLIIYRGLEISVKRDVLKEEEEKLHFKLEGLDIQDQMLQSHFGRIRLRERIACPSNSTESLSSRYQKKLDKINKNRKKLEYRIKEANRKNDEISSKLSEILSVQISFLLKIENIGLQTAILSSMSLCSQRGISSRVRIVYEKDTRDIPSRFLMKEDDSTDLRMFAVSKEEDTSLKISFCFVDYETNYSCSPDGFKDYGEGDYLLIEFTDIYRNRYRYELPIKLRNANGNYSVILDNKHIPIIPNEI